MVLLHLDAFVGQNLTFSHQISVQLKTSEHFRAHFFVFRAQFLTKRRHFRPDPFLSCAERWQDLRAVRDSRGPCSEKGPFLARSPRGVFPNGCLRGISDAWRAYPAKTSSFRMHGARILPRTGDFPVRGRFRDAWSAKLATDCRPGTHRGGILPRQGTRERTAREYCHYQSPENAFRTYPAIAGRLGTHSVDILPSPDIRERTASAYSHCQSPGRATLSMRGSGFSPLAVLWGFGAQHFLCEGVDIPPSRGLTAGNDFESALFRWATMSPLRVLQSCAVLCAEAKSALIFI